MSKIKNWALRRAADFQIAREEGQGLAEYGLILALIAVACIVALTALGGGIATSLGNVTAKL
jgi:pilus assembly protein Flp/PilA